MRRSPFQSLKQSPVPVAQRPDGDWVYFVSTGAIDANTSPVDLQEKQRNQAKLTVLVLEAAEELARRKKISVEEAREQFMPSSEDKVAVALNPFDYLSSEQRLAYLELASGAGDLPFRVATLMMRHRLAYDLVVTEPAKARALQLYVKEPWFDVLVGTLFKFGEAIVQVSSPYDPESGSIGVTALPSALEPGDAGLMLTRDRTYFMGDPAWSDEDTRSLSLENSDGSESQINAIYRFYLRESGKLSDFEPKGEDESGKPFQSESKSKRSLSSSSQSQLTGTLSTGESSTTESEMNGSAPKTLETVPVG